MARLPAIIDLYKPPKFGIAVGIRLDKSTGIFSAAWGDQYFQSINLSELRNNLHKAIASSQQVEWRDVILITMKGEEGKSDTAAKVGLDFRRFHLSKQGERWYEVGWDDECNPRFQKQFYARDWNKEIPGHWRDTDFGDELQQFLLSYSESLWGGLCSLRTKLDTLYVKLQELVGSEDGRNKIAALSISLLAGEITEDRK